MTAESVPLVVDRLRAFLAARLPGASDVTVSGLQRAGTGSSRENWPFDASWRTAGGTVRRPLLLRRDPPSAVVDTGRATEFALLGALAETAVPVPAAYWLDDTGEHLLRPSMVVERLPGSAHRAVLRERNPLQLTAQQRQQLAVRMCDLLADVHRVDVDAAGLRDVLDAPEHPAETELHRWLRRLDRAELEPQPALRWTARWLRDHLPPPPPRLVLVHGDFRPANVLVHDGTVRALLDWELAHLGDPLDDLGWYCAPLYAREHFVTGSWERADLLRRYTERTGHRVDEEALRFWQVMTVFRLAVIALQGVRIFCTGESDRPTAPVDAVVRHAVAALDGG